jgi:hypothetical protein
MLSFRLILGSKRQEKYKKRQEKTTKYKERHEKTRKDINKNKKRRQIYLRGWFRLLLFHIKKPIFTIKFIVQFLVFLKKLFTDKKF